MTSFENKPQNMRGRCQSAPNLCLYEGSSNASSPAHAAKRVSFTELEIREYHIIVGDHPCCLAGVPVALGWNYEDKAAATLDDYELYRCPRRQRIELRTTPEERRQMLVNAGAQEEEIRKAQRQLHRARSCSAKLCESMNQSFFSVSVAD
jgi:hypothetical protein